MTAKQAAEKLEVSSATIYNMITIRKLRCVRVGIGRGVIRILPEHIEQFLSGTEPVIEPAPPAVRHLKLKHLR